MAREVRHVSASHGASNHLPREGHWVVTQFAALGGHYTTGSGRGSTIKAAVDLDINAT